MNERVIRSQRVIFRITMRKTRLILYSSTEYSEDNTRDVNSKAGTLSYEVPLDIEVVYVERNQELPDLHPQFRRETLEVAEPCDGVVGRRRLWHRLVEYAWSLEPTNRAFDPLEEICAGWRPRKLHYKTPSPPWEPGCRGASFRGHPWIRLTGGYHRIPKPCSYSE